jgi:HEAT repeat protein
MPASDRNGGLGGLARSIDALFSQSFAAPAVDEEPEADEEQAAAPPVREEPQVDVATVAQAPVEPFPVERPPADLMGVDATPEEPLASEEPEGSALADAVDSFLAGTPGAADEVRDIAAKLQERLALDPLADAAERLVEAGSGPKGEAALDLALDVVNPAVASRLVQRLGHEEDEDGRATYVMLSKRLGMVMARAFRGAMTDHTDERHRRAYHEALIAMGDTSRPVIEAMVEDDNRFLVRNAVALLGEMGGEGAVELVTSALANTDFRVRREALTSLAKLEGDDSGQLVLASLEDPHPKVRAAAAEAAGRMGLERALRPMLALLEDDSLDGDENLDEDDVNSILVQVLDGLGHLGDPGAVQAIEKRAAGKLFSRAATEVRVAAYRALHAIGTPHAREVIGRATDDKDPVVRTTVRGLAAG